MANEGEKDTNSSIFYVTMCKTDWLDNECVVFGRVSKGAEVLKEIHDYIDHHGWHMQYKIII